MRQQRVFLHHDSAEPAPIFYNEEIAVEEMKPMLKFKLAKLRIEGKSFDLFWKLVRMARFS